jgi:hypothetical protein
MPQRHIDRLTDEEVQQIRQLYRTNAVSVPGLALRFDRAEDTIRKIAIGGSYRSVPEPHTGTLPSVVIEERRDRNLKVAESVRLMVACIHCGREVEERVASLLRRRGLAVCDKCRKRGKA